MKRRALLAATLALALAPRLVSADCAIYPPAAEARAARHVFEGRVVAVDGARMTFEVVALWKGNPPARVTVGTSGRWLPTPEAVGQTWLVFAAGESDASLAFSRCGSTGALPARPEVLAALTAAGLTRAPR